MGVEGKDGGSHLSESCDGSTLLGSRIDIASAGSIIEYVIHYMNSKCRASNRLIQTPESTFGSHMNDGVALLKYLWSSVFHICFSILLRLLI